MTYLILGFVLFFLFSVQTSLLGMFSLAGVTPDLILIVAVYCGIHSKKYSGICLAVLIGFYQDCLSGGLLGVNSLSKDLTGLFFCALKDKIFVEGPIPISFFIFFATYTIKIFITNILSTITDHLGMFYITNFKLFPILQ